MNKFEIDTNDLSRLGKIITSHGEIQTPAFIFCGTKGAIKGLDHSEIFDSTQILLCNTFHLQDMADIIEGQGGIHKFINWNKPIITDSGGFQIFSLGNGYIADEIKGKINRKNNLVKINNEGCHFKNPINGDDKFLSPIESIKIQIKLGVDFVVAFDECTTSHAGYKYTKKSTLRSHDWEKISLDYFNQNKKPHQSIYGIVQGGTYEDLRDESIKFINNNDFWGTCIGGSLGKTKEDMYNVVKYVAPKLDRSRPIHLLGIGKVDDIIELCEYVDTFDCVEPTRIARHGTALIKKGKLNLKNACFKEDSSPIDENCKCLTCQKYSRAYINYLLRAKELSAISLIVRHNIEFMNDLMHNVRYALGNKQLNWLKNEYL